MDYDILITGTGEFDNTFEFPKTVQTSLSGEIVLFGLRLGNNLDISLAEVVSISGNEFTWKLPLTRDSFPNIGLNDLDTYALFVNSEGDFQEISANITGFRRQQIPQSDLYDFVISSSGSVDYVAAFQTTLPGEISNATLSLGIDYDISRIELLNTTNNVFEWEVPFLGTDISDIGPNVIPINASFFDVDGNFQEISGNINAYKIPALQLERNYYVQLRANINKDIYQNQEGDFGLRGAIISKEEELYDLSYSLPLGSGAMRIKTINVKNLNQEQIGSVDLMLEITTTSDGTVVPRVYFEGDVTTTLPEDLNSAQTVYFGLAEDGSIIVNTDSADNLSATLTPQAAASLFPSQISALEALYQRSVLSSWTMEILDADPTNSSILNQIYETTGQTRSLPNFFAEGESITLVLGHRLELTVKDLNNEDLQIIEPTMVYAVITQNSSAPPLNPV